MEEPSIRTPVQRLRVFVSSTLAELAEERGAVHDAIEGLQLTPVMFELGARPHSPETSTGPFAHRADHRDPHHRCGIDGVRPGNEDSGPR